jgi:PEP-CTERM motif
VANVWSSDPGLNSDGKAHLALTDTFSDFKLPGHLVAPFPVTTNCVGGGLSCYLGWEDRPNPNPSNPNTDFNDLVFAEQFTPTTVTGTPEPASMTLLGSGLIALGMVMRRRRRKAA